MFYKFPFSNLSLCNLNVMKQLCMFNKILVRLNIQEHSSTPPMLCQNKWPTGFFYLVYKGCSIGSKF